MEPTSDEPRREIANPPIRATIQYVDAHGIASLRDITIRTVLTRNGLVYLECFDNELEEERTFRLDRVRYFITEDGKRVDPAPMLQAVTGGPAPQPDMPLAAQPAAPRKKRRWGAIDVIFGFAYVFFAAVAVSLVQTEADIGLAVFVFLFAAVPVFAVHAILRWLIRKLRSK